MSDAKSPQKTRKPPAPKKVAGRGVMPQAVRRRRPEVETKQQLIELSGELIGEYGFAGCSIARLTQLAGISHGAFYRYFSSQQDLFDQVLPTFGKSMLAYIGAAVQDCADILEIERAGFNANFDYLLAHPYMYRLQFEAQMYSPEGYFTWQDHLATAYARSLQRRLPPEKADKITFDDLKVVTNMLIGARTWLWMSYGLEEGKVVPLSDQARSVYLKFSQRVLQELLE
jgi:AcrR family transcriptional regulator